MDGDTEHEQRQIRIELVGNAGHCNIKHGSMPHYCILNKPLDRPALATDKQ